MKLSRIATRLLYHLTKFPLKVTDFLSARLYMRWKLALMGRMGVRLTGKPRYISPGCKFDDFAMISIGADSVISDRVVLLTHDYSLTTALRRIGEAPASDVAFIRPIRIGANVFIGMGSILLPGTEIGDDVIIGAGSIVRGKIPSDSIVTGNPATVVGSLSEKAPAWRDRMASTQLRVD